jgi:hypothetical protein
MNAMPRRPPPSVVLVGALAALAIEPTARAHHNSSHDQNPSPPAAMSSSTVYAFAAGSIIIPMDSCYDRPSFMADGDLGDIVKLTYGASSATTSNKACNGTTEKDDGIIDSYSLMQRLVKDGIKVYWAIRPGKTGWHDYDVAISKAGGAPVTWRNRAGSTSATKYSALTEIRYAGAPFIIDSTQAAAALAKLATYSSAYNTVDLHVATTAFQAPIFSSLSSLPKLAIIDLSDGTTDLSNEQTKKLAASVDEAGMSGMANTWYKWVTIPEVKADKLVSDGYKLAWVPPFDLKTGVAPTSAQTAFFAKLTAFAAQGGHILFMDGAVAAMEGYGNYGASYAEIQVPTGAYQTNGGLVVNGITSSWDNGNDDERTLGQDYSDPAAQFGGMVWTGIGGSKYNWKPRYDRAYHAGVRRMIYSDHASDDTKDRWDIATWRRYNNATTGGVIYYLGGDNWRKNTAAGFRVLLNTVFVHAGNVPPTTTFVARAAPVVGPVNDVQTYVQGSFSRSDPDEVATTFTGAASAAGFRFPHRIGQVRGYNVTAIATTATAHEAMGTPLWDAASHVPTPTAAGCSLWFAGSCRSVFTTTATGALPPRIMMSTANRSLFGSLLGGALSATDQDTLIGLLLAGRIDATTGTRVAKLGGVDRSSVALIEASPIAPTRPKMIYVNALDGMLHAICAEVKTGTGCDAIGRELWAYVPRTQLGKLRLNTQKLNGSPRVGDFLGNFDGQAGDEWRTVLAFATGSGTAASYDDAPAVIGVDITDPTNPAVLWEVATPATRGASELGLGLDVVVGNVRIDGSARPAVFVSTNQGGTGTAGVRVMAYSAVNGTALWPAAFTYTYPAPRTAASGSVPATGVPGGLAGYDEGDTGSLNRLAVPTLYGDLFVLDAATGTNLYGSNPVFRVSQDKKPIGAPPAIYKNDAGAFFAVVVTGGYVDDTAGATWTAGTQHVAAVKLDVPQNQVPLTELGQDGPYRPFVVDITGQGFAQPTIAGGELFVLTASTDINTVDPAAAGTGQMVRINLGTGEAQTYGVGSSGAAATEVVNGTVYISGTTNTMKVTPSGFIATGVATELQSVAKSIRRFWIAN